jgi:biopolymer transport protein ExbB/TolQ
MHPSFVELWSTMGATAKAVALVLGLMSLASLAAAAERWLALLRVARESGRFVESWRRRTAESGFADAAAQSAEYPHSPLAQAIAAGTAVLRADLPPDVRREAFDRTIRRAVLAAGTTLRRGLPVLATVGSTAPFVGLLGTVIGIVNAFHELAGSAQGGVGQVSSGVAEALVTTALGIAIAIPAVWMFNYFTQWVARLLTETECAAEELAVAALSEGLPPRAQHARASS